MMLCPSAYVSVLEDEPYNVLIEKKNNLVEEIKELEEMMFSRESPVGGYDICPSPDVMYQVKLDYLSELCKLMTNRFNADYELK